MDGPSKDKFMKLIEENERIEMEIRNEQAVLMANHFGTDDSLVDEDSFPRNDIDACQESHPRHRLVCLQNDHKNLKKQIEKALMEICTGEAATNGEPNQGRASFEPDCFAVVGCVQTGSPADLGGLCEHDKIIHFGSICSDNFINMTQLQGFVSRSICRPVLVKVLRGQHIVNVSVVPRHWEQPGLLGCQILQNSVLDT